MNVCKLLYSMSRPKRLGSLGYRGGRFFFDEKRTLADKRFEIDGTVASLLEFRQARIRGQLMLVDAHCNYWPIIGCE